MFNVKVSIIIPIYNVEKYLERCLKSVAGQTLHDIEVLCIDDCSTDNSLNILKDFQKKDSRIKVIALDKNRGAAVARNKGLEAATGDYYGFVDPDDEIDLNYYESLYQKAEETGAQVVKCERRTVELDGKIFESHRNDLIRKYDDLYFTQEWQCGLYKASLIKDNGIRFIDELIKAQDIVFLNEVMLKKTTPLAFVDGVYYNLYRRTDSLNAARIPFASIKSAIMAKKYQALNVNKSNLQKEKPDVYSYLYMSYCEDIIGYTSFQNESFEAKLECAEGGIDIYNMCLDKRYLKKHFPYKRCLPYIVSNDSENLAKILYKAKESNNLKSMKQKAVELITWIPRKARAAFRILSTHGLKELMVRVMRRQFSH